MKIKNEPGLCFSFLENGLVKSIEAEGIRINLKEGMPYAKSGTSIFLRKRSGPIAFMPLLGPESNSRFRIERDRFVARGSWSGLDYVCSLRLSGKDFSWQWRVDIQNHSGESQALDLIYLQDISLKPANSGLINEYYVSQYLERRILEDEQRGAVVCCRQNMKENSGHPWVMMACTNGAASACTDGMLFFGKTYRETGIPECLLADRLGGEYAGESAVCAFQEKPFHIDSGDSFRSTLVSTYLPDHPKATSEEDLKRLPGLIAEFDEAHDSPGPPGDIPPATNLFNTSPFLPVDDLNEQELQRFFGPERRHPEAMNGRLLSFFCQDNNHVVLRAKEVMTDRPHAHILQAKAGLVPDESIVSTTSFAFGAFNSHVTQGNTNFNVFLSICTTQFNQAPEHGQRIFVALDGKKYLLGVPSAFEMGLNHCRWIYRHGDRCFQVRTWTSKSSPQVNMEFSVISGKSVGLMITHQLDEASGWRAEQANTSNEYMFRPEPGSMIAGKFPEARFRIIVQPGKTEFKAGGDEMLSSDGKSRGGSMFVLDFGRTSRCCVSIVGEVARTSQFIAIEDTEKQWLADSRTALEEWRALSLDLSLEGGQEDIAAIREILPWYGLNALTHYLTPYGLEQFGGAAWGTRDVSQGPVDLLLAMEKYEEAATVISIIFSNQNPDGGWPQWWMFDSYHTIRAHEAHGDIFFWCIIALANYVRVTGDTGILDKPLPYYHEQGPSRAETAPLRDHVERLIQMITGSFIPGTSLVPFGGGDWNDSLQPVSADLAGRMVSSWTVEMNYQAFMQLSDIYEWTGDVSRSERLKKTCQMIRSDFNKHLVRDGVVAGYGLREKDGSFSPLLHPQDQKTGIHYSILPMERGIISEIFTQEQALYHQELIEKHLKGPDGARLMDRPLRYKGGIQKIFQRAESSTFFGREIGLMYVHEHIRYAEALARTGKAEAFVKALRQAIPVGYRDVVPCSDYRQSNCYYSSSDVSFKNRYEADERYDEIITGHVLLKGGWRVYSSGPGIFIGLIITRLLGLRMEAGKIIIDPVLPHSWDGFTASAHVKGYPVVFQYSVKNKTHGPQSISLNGKAMSFHPEKNKYRPGGAVIQADAFMAQLHPKENVVRILM
jgi:cellobiose phosphorylase